MSDSQRAYVWRESLIAVAINSVLSLLFALAVSAGRAVIPLWGGRGMALDFGPQLFMMTFAASLAVTLLTRKRLRTGAVEPLDPAQAGFAARAPQMAILRAALFGIAAVVAFGPLTVAAMAFAGVDSLPTPAFLVMKVFYGALVTLLIAPSIVRAALASAVATPLRAEATHNATL